jgi:hypothetical protein
MAQGSSACLTAGSSLESTQSFFVASDVFGDGFERGA